MVNLKSKTFSILLHIILLMLVVDSLCERKYDNTIMKKRFESWLQHHNKHYESRDEWMTRFGIYQANLNFIDYINSQNLSYKLGDNEFADVTNDEFKALYVGRLLILKPRVYNSTAPETQQEVPAEIDWRKKGAITPIKNQGKCGSCWAFSAVAGVESITQIKTGKLVALSEQQIIDCDTKDDDLGCKGGLNVGAFKYIQENGLTTDKEYPYTQQQGKCKEPAKTTAKISGFKTVKANSEASLLTAVAQQPVCISVEAGGQEFQLYKSGIFQGKCGTNLDHDVITVGYGEEGGKKFWIIKNSWGASWGEAGYMRALRDGAEPEGTCGLAIMPSFPVM